MAEMASQFVGGADEKSLQVADRPRARRDGTLPRRQQDPERLPITTPARLGEVLSRKRLHGSTPGVELVRLRSVTPRGSDGSIDLEDPFALFEQGATEPGPETARSLDRPRSPVRRMLPSEGKHAPSWGEPPSVTGLGRGHRVAGL